MDGGEVGCNYEETVGPSGGIQEDNLGENLGFGEYHFWDKRGYCL